MALTSRLLIGSSSHADLVLRDPTVSRLHAEVVLLRDEVWIRDLDSLNGVYVRDVRVREAQIQPGMPVLVGATRIELCGHSAGSTAARDEGVTRFGPLIGASPAMGRLFTQLLRVAADDVSVLLCGETGTGKELCARAIHDASRRASGPFVVVDCGALPEQLLDAELFGHTRGAFTGAVSAREGAFEAASGGTVFLDEIGELPLSLQPKLLRALEARTIRRLGESAHRSIDVRFIAATHRALVGMVARRAFREDLYFRLAVVPLSIPSLRERREDIALHARHFASMRGKELAEEFLTELTRRPWPGNVRELRNAVERYIAMGDDWADLFPPESTSETRAVPTRPRIPISSASVPTPSDASVFDLAFKDFRERWMEAGERDFLRRRLGGQRNVSAVAREVGITRTHLHRLLRKYAL